MKLGMLVLTAMGHLVFVKMTLSEEYLDPQALEGPSSSPTGRTLPYQVR
jgi:hypothetical protein